MPWPVCELAPAGGAWRVRPRWGDSLIRACTLACAVIVHLALLLWLQLPPTPWQALRGRKVPASGGDTLRVRFIDVRVARAVPAPAAPPLSRRPVPSPARPPARRLVRRVPPAPSPDLAPLSFRAPALPMAPAPGNDGAYVDGSLMGRMKSGRLGVPRVPPLPGSDRPLVPGLHLVDPRSQGLAGAIRGISGFLFGAVDPTCVEVDAWRGMTPDELAARDLTPDDVERLGEHNGCIEHARQDAPTLPSPMPP